MGELEKELRARGVQASLQALLTTASVEAIARTIEWWDTQRAAGPGVLVETIRRGGIAERSQPRSFGDEQREYGDQICEWLNRHFADLRQETGRPHPGAVVAVLRLHKLVGKGRLRKAEHEAEIREAVQEWDRRWGGQTAMQATRGQA